QLRPAQARSDGRGDPAGRRGPARPRGLAARGDHAIRALRPELSDDRNRHDGARATSDVDAAVSIRTRVAVLAALLGLFGLLTPSASATTTIRLHQGDYGRTIHLSR